MSDQKPTLSLCMIVKNEERFLPQCLNSVKDVVDEVIVVDTGSEDRTVEIAESYGCKVYHHPWEGSFSKARNISLGYATCDWILVMDPDEELEREDIPILKKVLPMKEIDVIYFLVLSENPFGETRHYSHRVFRRGIAHYEGIVHNQLVYKGNKLDTNIRLYHYGYNLSPEEMAAKFDRTQALLQKQLDEDPTEPFANFNYLRVLRARDLFEEGARHGLKALEICKERMTQTHRQMLTHDTGYCLTACGRNEEAETLVRNVLKDHPDNLDLLMTLSAALVNQQKFREALVPLYHFIEVKGASQQRSAPTGTRLIVDTYELDHLMWANIADCHYELGEYEKGVAAAEKAMAIYPDKAIYKITVSRNLLKLNRTGEAKKYIESALSNDVITDVFFTKWLALAKEFPQLGSQVDIVEKGVIACPDDASLQNMLAYYKVKSDPETAEKAWLRTLELNENHIGAYVNLLTLYLQQGDDSKTQSLIAGIMKNSTADSKLFVDVGRVLLQSKRFEAASEVLSCRLKQVPDDMAVLADIASCYAQMGQYEAAFMGYQAVLKIEPDNESVKKNLKVLAQMMKLDTQ